MIIDDTEMYEELNKQYEEDMKTIEESEEDKK